MEDQSLFTNSQSKEISEGLQNFIDSMVEEIVLEGRPFDKQKRYLKKFSENEGVDYDKLEADINTFLEILQSLKFAFDKLQVKLAEDKGRECHISENTIKKLVKYSSDPRQPKANKPAEEIEKQNKSPYLKYGFYGVICFVLLGLTYFQSFLLFKSDNSSDSSEHQGTRTDTIVVVKRDTIVKVQYSTEAEQLYRAKAENGDISAQFNLGCYFYSGEKGLSQNYAEAVKWYTKAASQGHAAAQNNLGYCYEKGFGVDEDIEKAKYWYQKAVDLGNSKAKINLERIVKNTGNSPSKSPTSLNNHEYVDLGLSVNWATCNVGSNRPEDFGIIVAWGETSPKSSYTWNNYKYRISGTNSGNIKLSKYVTERWAGSVDNKKKLELIDDVANVLWGDGWRMPQKKEYEELLNHCSWNWTSQNGIKGYIVTSKKAGFTNRSIFFPVDINHLYHNTYWSGSINYAQSTMAWYLCFNEKSQSMETMFRIDGRLVRAVCKKQRNYIK